MDLQDKYQMLKNILKDYSKVAIAFSGGVDSTFLLKTAHDVLGDHVIAVTARSSTYPEREYNEAVTFVNKLGIKHITILSEELDIEGFSGNPKDRCYYCKKELYTKLSEVAAEYGIKYIAEGTNKDDLDDYRPGMKALTELGIVSPLKEADLTKEEIRSLSKEMGLPTWDKQSFACLASRFPYGHEITKEKLEMIDKAEQYLLDLGFRQVRVRHHGDIARIEVVSSERTRFLNDGMMDMVHQRLKEIGFQYVALDLRGYRTGSMNEVIFNTSEVS